MSDQEQVVVKKKRKSSPRGKYNIQRGETPNYHVLSLGWGVQSWTIAAMAAIAKQGCECDLCQKWDIPGMARLDFCVHADTTFEKEATYTFSRQWTPWLEERNIPVALVRQKNRKPEVAQTLQDGSSFTIIPAYAIDSNNKRSVISRGCTNKWKIEPVQSYLLHLLRKEGIPKSKRHISMWLGISLDEWTRMKDSSKIWIVNHYPLIDRRMTRNDCKEWLKAHDLPVPVKSSCMFCPYQKKKDWQLMREEGGSDWDNAVKIDNEIRLDGKKRYVHRSYLPLERAVKPLTKEFQIGMFEDDDQDSDEPTCDSGYCFT